MLIELLQTFSGTERRLWLQFVNSPYHNQNKYVQQLATIIGEAFKRGKELDKKQVWEQLFPKVTYNEAKFNNYISDLFSCSQSFLIQESFKKEEDLKFDILQQQLIKRGQLHLAERVSKKWQKQRDTSTLQNGDAFYGKFRFHYLQDQLSLRQKNRSFGTHLQQKSLEFDRYYLLQQLIHHAEFLNRRNIVKGDFQLAHLDGLMRRYDEDEQSVQGIPTIKIYAFIVKMLLGHQSDDHFEKIADLINQHDHCLNTEENQSVYNYLFNFAVKQINSGNTDYYSKIFKLYQAIIGKGLLLQNGSLSQWTYTNIITVGIRLKEWKWTESFLNSHQSYLPSAVRSNAFQYNLAAIHFERDEYAQALTHLNILDFKDAFYQMAAKTIQLKIYYKLNESEAFEALEAATRQFISRNKQLSDYQQLSNINFIKLLKKINAYRADNKRWKPQKRNLTKTKLLEIIQLPNHPLAHKDWLKTQLELLTNGAT